jgi:hypothetical protein
MIEATRSRDKPANMIGTRMAANLFSRKLQAAVFTCIRLWSCAIVKTNGQHSKKGLKKRIKEPLIVTDKLSQTEG